MLLLGRELFLWKLEGRSRKICNVTRQFFEGDSRQLFLTMRNMLWSLLNEGDLRSMRDVTHSTWAPLTRKFYEKKLCEFRWNFLGTVVATDADDGMHLSINFNNFNELNRDSSMEFLDFDICWLICFITFAVRVPINLPPSKRF